LINVTAVMRRRDGVEEWLDRDNVWRAEQRDLDVQVHLPISEEELDRLKWTAAWPDWFVVHDGAAYPYAVVRKIPSAEEAFTRDLRWEPSDLLERDDLKVEKLGHPSAAYDPRAAMEVGVRAERLRARGGSEYFTLWDRVDFAPGESTPFFSVIRRTEAGEEVHVGRSGWVPSRMVRGIERGKFPFYRALPITAEEAEEIIAQRSGPRCYHVLSGHDGLDLPFAVVQVDGEHEEAFTRDLVWGPSDLLSRVAGERGLRVEEFLPNWTADNAAFRMAGAVRRRRRSIEWESEHWYFAIFPDEVAALDLANAHEIVRTRAGGTRSAETCRNGEWTYSWIMDDIGRGKSDDVYLPISPAEAQRLMKLLDDR
jgi:hypothetical protein